MPDFRTFKRWVMADWEALRDWRRGAREDFAFDAGDQWTDDEKQRMSDANRIPIVFNRTATIINAVAGSEINNRTEVRYMPRTLGDAEVNEVLTKGGEWFRDRSGAEEEESQAFRDSCVCGLGWTETMLDFEFDPEGEPRMERIDPLEMGWDASARRRCLTDAHRFFRVRELPVTEIREMFDQDVIGAKWIEHELEEDPGTQWSDDDYSHTDPDDPSDVAQDEKTAVIVQLQYRQRVREVEYVDPQSGQRQRMGKRKFTALMKRIRETGLDIDIPNRDIVRHEWKQVFLGDKIIEENQPCADHATFVPITGYWDNAKHRWFGLLRQIRDPQKYANKWLSQVMHIINANAKGGVMAEKDATDDHVAFEDNWAAADSVQWLMPGALSSGKVQPKPQVQTPASLINMTEFAVSSIRDVSGVNQELLGLRDQNQPGVLEYQRKQAAMTTLATLFDALRHYRKHQAEVMLFFMVNDLADGRLVRIADEMGERYERFTLPEGAVKYDVIIDDAPSSPNNKERVWETIMAMMPMLERAGLSKEIWAEIISYSPFPTALIEKLREFAAQPEQPDPMQQQMMQLALKKAAADAAVSEAAVGEKQAEAERERANAFENMAQGMKYVAEAEAVPLEQIKTIYELLARQQQAMQPQGRPVIQ